MEIFDQLFDNFGISLPKFLAQLFLFFIVYFLLSKFAFGPVLAMLEERRRKIEEAQQNSEKIKRQLAEAELRYQEIVRKASQDANKILEEARATSEATARKLNEQALKDAELIVQRARQSAELEHQKMLNEARSEIIGLIITTTSKVAGKILTEKDQKRLAQEATKELAI